LLLSSIRAFEAIDKQTPWMDDAPKWWIAWQAEYVKANKLLANLDASENTKEKT